MTTHLHGLPVEPALDAELVGVSDGGRGGDDGADRAEGVEGLSLGPLAEGALPVPPAHVVAARVALSCRRRRKELLCSRRLHRTVQTGYKVVNYKVKSVIK